MANLIPAVTRHEIARSVYRDIITGKDFYYVFAGKTFTETGTPVDTRRYNADIHKNMILAKRIVPGPNDVVYMIERKDWESGTTYVAYSDYTALGYESNGTFVVQDFYVMTDEYHIYKCLKAGAGTSTIKPTSMDPEPEELDDGYIWKFMYEVPVLDRIKFLTSEYIPVRNVSDGVNFDVNGVIESVRIEAPGQGYTDPYLVIQGDGLEPQTITFDGASAVTGATGDDIHTIQYVGHSFITGDRVLYNTGGGTAVGGLTNNNVYYVIFYSSSKIRLATSLANAEANTYITITDGAGVSHKLTPISSPALGVSGVYRNSVVTIDGTGAITDIEITDSMRGYTHARAIMYDAKATPYDYDPAVSGSEVFSGTISADMEDKTILGTGTAFTAELQVGWSLTDHHNNIIGVVASITSNTELELVNYPDVDVPNESYGAFAGGGFEGVVILGAEVASQANRDVVADTVHGAIYRVDVLNGGTGYDDITLEVEGDGTGVQLYVDPTTDINANGTITNVQITNYGQNYNYGDVVVSGIHTTAASFRIHVGPQRGHGFNIAQELFARTLCISATITTENNDLFEGNDFRQLGVVKNLKLYNSIQDVDIGYLQEDTATAAFILTVPEDEYIEYNADDEIEASTGGIYKVLTKLFDEVEEVYKVYLLYVSGTEGLTTDTTFTNTTTEYENLSCSAVVEPEFDKNTGTIIYVNEFSPISRTAEQFETIKLFLHF